MTAFRRALARRRAWRHIDRPASPDYRYLVAVLRTENLRLRGLR